MNTYVVAEDRFNEHKELAVFIIDPVRAESWEKAEAQIPYPRYVLGELIAEIDFETGLQIDYDNNN